MSLTDVKCYSTFPEWRTLTSFAVFVFILLKTLGNSAKIRDFPRDFTYPVHRFINLCPVVGYISRNGSSIKCGTEV